MVCLISTLIRFLISRSLFLYQANTNLFRATGASALV